MSIRRRRRPLVLPALAPTVAVVIRVPVMITMTAVVMIVATIHVPGTKTTVATMDTRGATIGTTEGRGSLMVETTGRQACTAIGCTLEEEEEEEEEGGATAVAEARLVSIGMAVLPNGCMFAHV